MNNFWANANSSGAPAMINKPPMIKAFLADEFEEFRVRRGIDIKSVSPYSCSVFFVIAN
jgi:hypothetical protein